VKPDQPGPESYGHAAWLLLCEERALRAVAQVESGPQGAFDEEGRPTILYERTWFSRLTEKRFDGHAPSDISHPSHVNENYGKYSEQYGKLETAREYDDQAALKSCSWGLYQIMGFNHEKCGFDTMQRMVNAMWRSSDDHLRALTMLLRSNSAWLDAIRAKDWLRFALLYNGPSQKGYDKRMEEAYAELG